MTELRIGQIWADNDKRAYGRQLRIVGFEHEPRYADLHAICEVVSPHRNSAGIGKRTVIRADRFQRTATGYRLVEDAP